MDGKSLDCIFGSSKTDFIPHFDRTLTSSTEAWSLVSCVEHLPTVRVEKVFDSGQVMAKIYWDHDMLSIVTQAVALYFYFIKVERKSEVKTERERGRKREKRIKE